MCTRQCGGEVGRCLLAAYFANGGYTVLYGRQSPTERLIPADRFRKSERALRLPVRRVAMELAAEPDRLADRARLIRSGSSCFATEVLRDIRRLEETRGE